jgi:coatomer subunit beta
MWTEFEWENKVNVNTTIRWVYRIRTIKVGTDPLYSDLRQYLEHIMKSTNMACLTPDAALSGDCDFLSANLCARSLFGEDALANLSIEKTEEGVIQGHVRIRSKTQGIALSLGEFVRPFLLAVTNTVVGLAGDKITLAQKTIVTAPTV